MTDLAGKVAIVTGAGSSGPGVGNGKATSILFAREGARVLCVDQILPRAEETVGLIRAEGGESAAHAADVTRADDCRAMVEAAVGRWGGLDVLHNNVGIESRKDLLETTEEDWDRVIGVDLVAWGAVLFLLWHARRTESFASAILLNFVFFGWFAWAAFPWLGEMP
jgi:NAD(P)-dependent dehydrogenase (short-subunit alcohol dehydrogenase family)